MTTIVGYPLPVPAYPGSTERRVLSSHIQISSFGERARWLAGHLLQASRCSSVVELLVRVRFLQ
ncbi:hypothetical protein V2J09_022567 [Rumex salicifolius]